MAGKKTSAHAKLMYGSYKTSQTWKKNRLAKLKRHLELHPGDEIAMAAIKKTETAAAPRRAKYKTQHLNRTSGRLVAQLKRVVAGAEKAAKFEKKKNEEKLRSKMKA